MKNLATFIKARKINYNQDNLVLKLIYCMNIGGSQPPWIKILSL